MDFISSRIFECVLQNVCIFGAKLFFSTDNTDDAAGDDADAVADDDDAVADDDDSADPNVSWAKPTNILAGGGLLSCTHRASVCIT